jgi:hypothetical protein
MTVLDAIPEDADMGTSILGDVVDAVKGVEAEAMVTVLVERLMVSLNPTPLDTTHQPIGVNSLLRNAIKSAKTVIRMASQAVPTQAQHWRHFSQTRHCHFGALQQQLAGADSTTVDAHQRARISEMLKKM